MGLLEQAQSGGAVTPQLAEAAAQAGAPGPQQQTAAAPPGPPQETAAAPAGQPQQTAAGAGDLPLPEQEAAPDEQAEDKTANAIVDQVDPNDKIGSTAKVNILFMRELDKKVDLAESVVAAVTQEVTERVVELAEARHGIEYAPDEVEKILGATWEGVTALFGSDGGPEGAQSFQQFAQGMDSDALAQLKQQHEARLNG
jgi:hypothetical protein